MYGDLEKMSSEGESEHDGRQCLGVASHGKFPKWLQDMSRSVEQNHSLHTDREGFRSLDEGTQPASKSVPPSARYGRRAAIHAPKNGVSAGDDYIVPKFDEVSLTELVQSQSYVTHLGRMLGGFPAAGADAKENCGGGGHAPPAPRTFVFSRGAAPRAGSGRRSRIDAIESALSSTLVSAFGECSVAEPAEPAPGGALAAWDLLRPHSARPKPPPGRRARHRRPRPRPAGGAPDGGAFVIPALPAGRRMTVAILSTWGDRHYVGLNGIEAFACDGRPAAVSTVAARPPDVRGLPGCAGDPRVAANLLDGVNRTQDDRHIWLAPFREGARHVVHIEFRQDTRLAMLRIWNYNKSRIHSYRGARDVVITLDRRLIFQGEIAQACGTMQGPLAAFGDTILFTTDEEILEKISHNDAAYATMIASGGGSPERAERPPTASAQEEVLGPRLGALQLADQPGTAAGSLRGARRVDLVLLQNWGSPELVGLCGVELLSEGGDAVPLDRGSLRCSPGGHDPLARLVDGHNVTCDPAHMWRAELRPGREVVLTIALAQVTYLTGLRVWNYNEHFEATFAGVRLLRVLLDHEPLTNPLLGGHTFLLRRAPGNCHYDFVQEIRFSEADPGGGDAAPLYDLSRAAAPPDALSEQPDMPEGFVFQVVVYTTWGDQYYVGLNGIELYDDRGRSIALTESNVCAYPESVNVLPGTSGDVRTPDKLVDGVNDHRGGLHSWLAPVIPKCLNRIYVVFDSPTAVSVIKLWNYCKTPARGVREFGILVDDLLVYNGILDQANPSASVKHRTILFTNNKDVVQKEMASLVKHSIDSQGTVMMNNDLRMTTGGSLPNADQSLRPFTSVNHLQRGKSSSSS